MDKIFFSYRRADSGPVVGRIYDRLASAFGGAAVFRDVDGIPGAVDFRRAIDEALDACAIMLVVIGPRWLAAVDAAGGRRLDDPSDLVRLEIEGALARDMAILPLLVEGAAMPAATELPSSIAPLGYRNARPVRDDPDFHGDMQRAIADIARYVSLAEVAEDSSSWDAGVPSTMNTSSTVAAHRAKRSLVARLVLAFAVVASVAVGIVLLSHLGPTQAYTPNLLQPPDVSASCNGKATTPLAPAVFTIANDDQYNRATIQWSTSAQLNDGAVAWGIVSPAQGTIAHGKTAVVTIQFANGLCPYIETHLVSGLDFTANAQVSYYAVGASQESIYLSVDVSH